MASPTSKPILRQPNYSEVGKAAQIMPSWIRAACRSRLDYDEDELLDHMREKDVALLEASKFRDRFAFIEFHIGILKGATPDKVRKIVRARQHQSAVAFHFCRYETEGKKRACWSCPHVREVIEKLGGYDGKTSIF